MLITAFQPIQPKPAPPMRARQWDGTYVGATQILKGLRSVGATTRFIPEQVVPLGGEAIPAELLIRPHVPSQGPLPEVVRLLADDWLIITDEGDVRRATAEQFDTLFEFVHEAADDADFPQTRFVHHRPGCDERHTKRQPCNVAAGTGTTLADWINQWLSGPAPAKADYTAGNDPVAVAVDTVARRAIARKDVADLVLWEDFPEIGEHDWEAIVDRVAAIGLAMDPPDEEYDAAHILLQSRAADFAPDESEGGL